MVFDIEQYRENQYSDYQRSLCTPEAPELVKCECCGNEVEENETELCSMHDINNGMKLPYCKECIEIYKQENL